MSDEFDVSELSDVFFSEAELRLQELNRGLLELEENHENAEVLGEIFRVVHNLKSGAGLLGFHDLSSIAHRVEDVLQALRDGSMEWTPELFDVLFAGADALAAAKAAAQAGQPSAVDAAAVMESFSAMHAQVTSPQEDRERPADRTVRTTVSEPCKDDKREGELAEMIRVRVDRVDRLMDLVGELTVRRLREQERAQALRELMNRAMTAESALTRVRGETLASRDPESPGLDTALTYVQQLRRDLARFTKEFERATAELAELSDEVQNEALSMRMVPIASVFDPLPRLVRDLARGRNKRVRLVVEGRDTELDKKITESIADPLAHLVRNAVDHGIEDPEERQQAGKPLEGTITVRAAQRGRRVIVEVTDDGRGIDPGLVRTAAVRRGLISAASVAELDETEALNLVFRPGFSTSTKIDSVSGRGVGMDVVKSNVEALEGTVRIVSRVGKGTRVTLVLPLTLAISQALILRAGGQVFTIPTVTVSGLTEIAPGRSSTVRRKPTVRIGDRTVPLIHLSHVLGLPHSGSFRRSQSAMILGGEDHQVAFLVDEVIGEQPVVIKPLGSILRRAPNFAAGTILPNGRVALVLNAAELLSSARQAPKLADAAPAAPERPPRPRKVLVVDDAIATRELERSILAAAGYEVQVAIDGLDALEKLRGDSFDLIVADVEMPRMDGFALTAALRADERYTDVPVVIVTAHETDEDRRRGIEVGAQAYIVKSAFDQENLLATIKQLIG